LKADSDDASTNFQRQTVPRSRTGNAECTVVKVRSGTKGYEVFRGRWTKRSTGRNRWNRYT